MFDFYNDGELRFWIQEVDGQLFGHCSVSKWSKAMLHRVADVWEQFKKWAITNKYNYMYTIIPKDNKTLKFNLMFGSIILEETDSYYLLQFTLGE